MLFLTSPRPPPSMLEAVCFYIDNLMHRLLHPEYAAEINTLDLLVLAPLLIGFLNIVYNILRPFYRPMRAVVLFLLNIFIFLFNVFVVAARAVVTAAIWIVAKQIAIVRAVGTAAIRIIAQLVAAYKRLAAENSVAAAVATTTATTAAAAVADMAWLPVIAARRALMYASPNIILFFANDAVWMVELPTAAAVGRVGNRFRNLGLVDPTYLAPFFPAGSVASRITLDQVADVPVPVLLTLLLEMFESLTSPAIERLALKSVFVANARQQTSLPPVLPVVKLLALEEAVEVTVDEETESMPAQPVVEPLAHQDTVEASPQPEASSTHAQPVVEPLAHQDTVEASPQPEASSMPAQPVVEPFARQDTVEASPQPEASSTHAQPVVEPLAHQDTVEASPQPEASSTHAQPVVEPFARQDTVEASPQPEASSTHAQPVVEPLAHQDTVEASPQPEASSTHAQPVVEPLAHQDTDKVIVQQGSGLQSVPAAVELSASRDKNRVGKCAACTTKNLSHTSSAPTRPAAQQRAPRRAAMATKRSAHVMATNKDVVVQRLESKEVVRAAMKPIRLLAVQSRGNCSKSVPEIKKADPEAPLASSSSTCKKTVPKRLIPEATFVSCSESFSLDSENATLNEQDDWDVVSRSDASIMEPMKKRERFLLKAKQKTAKIRQVASSMSLRKRKSEMTDMNK